LCTIFLKKYCASITKQKGLLFVYLLLDED